MIFKANTKDGQLFVRDRESFSNYLKDLNGCEITLCVERAKAKKRSVEQNHLYYGIVRKIMQVLIDRGFDELNVVTLSSYFKKIFLSDIIVDPINGGEIEIVRSTTDLGVKEFAEYIDKVVRFALQDMSITPDSLKPFIDLMESEL